MPMISHRKYAGIASVGGGRLTVTVGVTLVTVTGGGLVVGGSGLAIGREDAVNKRGHGGGRSRCSDSPIVHSAVGERFIRSELGFVCGAAEGDDLEGRVIRDHDLVGRRTGDRRPDKSRLHGDIIGPTGR